jgi:hypothetical protein
VGQDGLAAGLMGIPISPAATDIVVRVMAKDAKFIATETGGAHVTLRDADTGEVLAQGRTAGGTGNTPRIMTEGRARRRVLSDDKAAGSARPLTLSARAGSPPRLWDR